MPPHAPNPYSDAAQPVDEAARDKFASTPAEIFEQSARRMQPRPAAPPVAPADRPVHVHEKVQFASGATRDNATNKGRFDLLPWRALRRVAIVYEKGGVLHGDRNWEKGMPFSRLYSSAIRHATAALIGDKSEDHLAQAVWNLLALMEFEERDMTALNDITPVPEQLS